MTIEKLPINTTKTTYTLDASLVYKTADGSHVYTQHGEGAQQLDTVDLWPTIPASIIEKNVIRMKKAIYYEGSVTVGIRITNDFYAFRPTEDNYFKYDGKSAMTGGHAICIVGWKTIGDTPVWICRNSWGENWGYGFKQPEWVEPVTGEKEQKYKGGFWNHIMGINDAFIESNATGCHPDLSSGDIQKFLSQEKEKTWYTQTTLREIHNENLENGQSGSLKTRVSNIIVEFPLEEMTAYRIADLFSDENVNAILLTEEEKTAQVILEWVNELTVVNYDSIRVLVDRLIDNIDAEIVFAVKGRMGVIFYMNGNPSRWNVLDLVHHLNYTTHLNVAGDKINHDIIDFKTNTKKDLKILILTNSTMGDMIKIGQFTYACECDTEMRRCDCQRMKEGFAGMVYPFPSGPESMNERMQQAYNAFPREQVNALSHELAERYRVLSYPYTDPFCGKMYPQIRKYSYQSYY